MTATGAPFTHVLFPGRHHLVTRFQVDYLRALLAGLVTGPDGAPVRCAPGATVIWALTSANHAGTRRNPLPAHRREALIERIATAEHLPSLVVPVVDTVPTPRFAQTVLGSCEVTLGMRPGPATTLVACSTPTVADMYAALGFTCVGVEADQDPVPARPWDVIEQLVAGQEEWEGLAHPETVAFYRRYRLVEKIRAVCSDPVVSSEGDLTATRDYRTYAAAFEQASARKWEQVAPHVRPGRIVDVGCASGGLLEQAAADPALHESDLYGVDVARPLLAEAEHKKAQGVFANPNVFFLQRNLLGGAIFDDRSVDTTISIALTHEIVSYGDGRADLAAFAGRIYRHTAPGGVWINSDVLGPAGGDRLVHLTLSDEGHNPTAAVDMSGWSRAQVADYVGGLSTRARLVQFARDFPALSGARFDPRWVGPATVELTLREAMEFCTTKDYPDNWLSECHERFCELDLAAWVDLVTEAGFEVDPATHAWRNEWLVEHRFTGQVSLTDPDGVVLDWPDTHLLLVARRSLDPSR